MTEAKSGRERGSVTQPDADTPDIGATGQPDITLPAEPSENGAQYTINNGVVSFGDRVIGEVSDGVLVLDSGWMRLAGAHVRVMADATAGESKRHGIKFER